MSSRRVTKQPAAAATSVPFALLAVALALAAIVVGPAACAAQGPTPLPVPCSSAATRALSDACILNLTYTHLGCEDARDWDCVMDTLSEDAYEYFAHTLMGGIKSAPHDSDQSLHYMYSRIAYTDLPADFLYTFLAQSVSASSIVFEFVIQFTHTTNFYLLPYPPTGRKVSVVAALSVAFDDHNKLVFEHTYVDGASMLAQIGVLKDGYGRYQNNDSEPCDPAHACLGLLPVIGDEMATLALEGAHNTTIRFNGFYATDTPGYERRGRRAPPAAGYARRVGDRSRVVPRIGFGSLAELVADRLDKANALAATVV